MVFMVRSEGWGNRIWNEEPVFSPPTRSCGGEGSGVGGRRQLNIAVVRQIAQVLVLNTHCSEGELSTSAPILVRCPPPPAPPHRKSGGRRAAEMRQLFFHMRSLLQGRVSKRCSLPNAIALPCYGTLLD